MKKIIALALALIMALSMGVVAFAAEAAATDSFGLTPAGPGVLDCKLTTGTVARPGEIYAVKAVDILTTGNFADYKIVDIDFTTGQLEGASMIESVKYNKAKTELRVTLKESYTMALETAKSVKGEVVLKKADNTKITLNIILDVNNTVAPVTGVKKAADATTALTKNTDYGKNIVTAMDEDGGYVKFTQDVLTGVVKMNKDEKTYLEIKQNDEDTVDAIEAYLGEDFDAIVEYYTFVTKAFKNDVDFSYDAYEEDDHFFYAWDGEKLTAINAKFDDDEDVNAYVWTGSAEGTIVVTDKEVVLAAEEDTKNPDTGANDVVGVAAALAVVSLVAAGAVSLKK